MIGKRSATAALLVASLSGLTLNACGRDSGAGSVPDVPPAGVVAGVYVETSSGSSDATPVADVTIGLFTEEYNPGLLMYAPPEPVARARTAGDGTFRFGGVEPGRYFAVPIDARAVVSGRWVTVGVDRGASVRLTGCSDCPGLA